MNMTFDYWDGLEDHGGTHENVIWPDVEFAIKKLDQNHYTLVVLDHDDQAVLMSGGLGRFVVTFDKGDLHELARYGSDNTRVIIRAGGQDGDFAVQNVLSLDKTLVIAKAYFAREDVHSSVDWDVT